MVKQWRLYLIAVMTVVVFMSLLVTYDLQQKSSRTKSVVYAQGQSEVLVLQELNHRHSNRMGQDKQRERVIEQGPKNNELPTNSEGIVTSENDRQPKLDTQQASQKEPVITVLLSNENTVEQVPLEQYVLGVSLAELPGSFEYEAIKAQMMAIRTYIVRRILQAERSEEKQSYIVTDTTSDQVYLSIEEVKAYEADYPEPYEKFVKALEETKGKIISYENEPIDALFFSTSNGYTENSDAVWGQEVAYLRSVASPWDEALSPSYESEVSISFNELYERLNLKESRRNGSVNITKVERTESGRIESLTVNGASFTGKELREKLALSSTDMMWTIDKQQESVTFICYGYGHGVGLSQWGANGMAKAGYLAEDIITHYYTGVSIEQASL
ncbi:stage II sporulation protein D [Paenibacillus camelliae]|uniref:stage II sporulation protein D n=1 Tax=Paenibacillus camelliae TaxID=512410 RepID=UPI00203ADDB2|nr:stage II sporulation protein D [Paenibacillus camelliae]MCM3635249.1 stage II sporulation protein D [Paenibacillus camelliae]